jgi:hypothetical protein
MAMPRSVARGALERRQSLEHDEERLRERVRELELRVRSRFGILD